MTISKIAMTAALGLTFTAGAAMACPLHGQTFTRWDADKDQQLAQAEFESGIGANADFGKIDADASGMLSQDESDAYVGSTDG